jgi:hypothetical protein
MHCYSLSQFFFFLFFEFPYDIDNDCTKSVVCFTLLGEKIIMILLDNKNDKNEVRNNLFLAGFRIRSKLITFVASLHAL